MDEHVKALYDMAGSAVAGRASMNEAVRLGTLSPYHKTLRETPEVKLYKPLTAVRSRLGELARRRRSLLDTPPASGAVVYVRKQLEADDVTKAMSAIAHGTLLWANEQLGLPVVPTAPPMQPTTAPVPDESELPAEASNELTYGEEQ